MCNSGSSREQVLCRNKTTVNLCHVGPIRQAEIFQDRQQALISLFIPRDSHGNFMGCRQYDVDVNSAIDQVVSKNNYINSSIINKFVAQNHYPTIQCRNGVDFDTDIYPETLATKVTYQ